MKEKRILNAIGQVNEEYIVEAAPARKARKQPKWIKWGAVAACLCFVLAGVLFSSTPTTPGFSLVMTAYAADGTGYEIGTTPVVITDDMSINSGFYARYDEGNGHGRENFLFRIRLTVKKMLKVCPIWKITMHGLPPKNCWKMRPLASFLYTQQDARLMAFIVTPMLATHILSTMMISVRPKFSSSTELQMITVSGLLMKSISL